jgi:prepilin-type N-terminal cleavage/methylation domain-containing protein/prepilin-type processing-associated H-X9-DG protein
MHRQQRGFTLIELLVVIAIIAILASILFPVFARARENARRASCQSNLKQIGLAITQYSQDYDEKNPIIKAYSADWSQNMESYDKLIAPYVGMKVQAGGAAQLFVCSSDAIPVTSARPGHTRRSYSVNALYDWVNGGGIAREVSAPDRQGLNIMVALSEIEDAAGTIMLAETPSDYNLFGSPDVSEVRSPKQPSWANWWQGQQDMNGSPRPTHFDGYNYLFADGHVKWLRPERTVGTGSMDWPQGMWTRRPGD